MGDEGNETAIKLQLPEIHEQPAHPSGAGGAVEQAGALRSDQPSRDDRIQVELSQYEPAMQGDQEAVTLSPRHGHRRRVRRRGRGRRGPLVRMGLHFMRARFHSEIRAQTARFFITNFQHLNSAVAR